MYSVHHVIDAMLAYLTPEERIRPEVPPYTGRITSAIQALNGAMQELHALSPHWPSRADKGVKLEAPRIFPATVSAGDDQLEIAGYPLQAFGCTARIAGVAADFIITNFATPYLTLHMPHGLEPGTETTVTIYHDAVPLDFEIGKVLSPVRIDGHGPLAPVNGMSGLIAYANPLDPQEDYQARARVQIPRQETLRTDRPGTPAAYFVDSVSTFDQVTQILRLAPVPDRTYFLSYRASMLPQRFSEEDVDNDVPIRMPFFWIQSLLFPVAMQRFTASPFFRNEAVLPEIARQYQIALKAIKDMNPQGKSGAALRAAW